PDDLDHLVYAHDALLLTACQPLTPAHGIKRCRSSPFSSEPRVQHPPLRHMMDPPAENGIRAEHESRAAKDEQIAARHQQLAGIWQALEAKAAKEAAIFTAVQDTRQQWEAVTETTRRIAIAADIELRRRH